MKRISWQQLASGLVAATLSVGIAACDDDTTTATDMAVGGDMSASAGDMTMTGSLATGQLVLADLVGTAFSPAFGPSGQAPRTHVILALPSLPVFSTASDPSSDLDLTGFKGCTVNRFTATNPPLGDGDAGLVSFSGWNTEDTIAVNKTNGSFSAGPMGTNNPINCSRLPPLMKYACFFGSGLNTDGGVGAAGALTGNVIFPIMPQRRQCLSTGTNLTAAPNWPYPTCIERGPIAVQPPAVGEVCPPYMGSAASVAVFACEQSPINPLGVAQITEKLSGGADFAATMGKIGNGGGLDGGPTQFPGPLYIVKVTSGTTDITAMGPDLLTGGNGLSFTDGAIDTTQALTITFSCDPNNLTKAAACTNNTLAALLIQTDTGKRSALAGGLPSGVGQCIAKPPLGEITVSAAQMQALIGTQTGGSIQLGLANLGLAFGSSSSHTLVFTAGMGAFGFTNQ